MVIENIQDHYETDFITLQTTIINTFEQEVLATKEMLTQSKNLILLFQNEENGQHQTRNKSLSYLQTITSLAPTTLRSKNGQYLKDVHAAIKNIDAQTYGMEQKINETESSILIAKSRFENVTTELENLKRQLRNLNQAKPSFASELDSLVQELSVLHIEYSKDRMNLAYVESELEQFDIKTQVTPMKEKKNDYEQHSKNEYNGITLGLDVNINILNANSKEEKNIFPNKNEQGIKNHALFDVNNTNFKDIHTNDRKYIIDPWTRQKKTILDSTINGLYRDLNTDIDIIATDTSERENSHNTNSFEE